MLRNFGLVFLTKSVRNRYHNAIELAGGEGLDKLEKIIQKCDAKTHALAAFNNELY